FASPVFLNPDAPGRDLALVRGASGLALAVTDVTGDTVSLFTASGRGVTRTVAFQAGSLPQRLAAADLDGDGLDDLVTANAGSDSVTIALQQSDGTFAAPRAVAAGVAPSDLAFADVDGAGGLDVLVSNRSSGDISVLFNDPAHAFTRTARYRAGTSVSGLQPAGGTLQPRSPEEPVSLVAGAFNGDRRPDLVVVSREARRLTLLSGTPGGGFANPQESLRTPTSGPEGVNDRPGQAATADFNADGRPDIAVLMEDRGEVWLYLGAGDGTFSRGATVRAGSAPTGLSTDDVDGDGRADLLVGNGFGDLLFI